MLPLKVVYKITHHAQPDIIAIKRYILTYPFPKSSLTKGYTRISFLARLSQSYLEGFLDLVNNRFTSVLIISLRARSVNTLSSIHFSTSGRQCSGINISALVETDEVGVETEVADKVVPGEGRLEVDPGVRETGDLR